MSETDISTAAVEAHAKRLRDHGHSGKGGILPVTLALLADRDRLAAEVARLTEEVDAWKTAFWTADQFAVAIHDADGKCYSVRAQDYHRMDELFHDRATHAARQEGET